MKERKKPNIKNLVYKKPFFSLAFFLKMNTIIVKNKTKNDFFINLDKTKKTLIKSNSKTRISIDEEKMTNDIIIKFKKILGITKVKRYKYDLKNNCQIKVKSQNNVSVILK